MKFFLAIAFAIFNSAHTFAADKTEKDVFVRCHFPSAKITLKRGFQLETMKTGINALLEIKSPAGKPPKTRQIRRNLFWVEAENADKIRYYSHSNQDFFSAGAFYVNFELRLNTAAGQESELYLDYTLYPLVYLDSHLHEAPPEFLQLTEKGYCEQIAQPPSEAHGNGF